MTTSIVLHDYNGNKIAQRPDGYVSLTAMAKAEGKRVNHYLDQKSTNEYLQALSSDTGIPATALIQVFQGGNGNQGTWAHSEVAIDFAQWVSPTFRVWANRTLRLQVEEIQRVQSSIENPFDSFYRDNAIVKPATGLERFDSLLARAKELQALDPSDIRASLERALLLEIEPSIPTQFNPAQMATEGDLLLAYIAKRGNALLRDIQRSNCLKRRGVTRVGDYRSRLALLVEAGKIVEKDGCYSIAD